MWKPENKPKTTPHTTSAKSSKIGLFHYGQNPDVRSILHLQNTHRNKAVQHSPQVKTESNETYSPGSMRLGFTHDISRISLHSHAPTKIQTKLEIGSPGNIYEKEADRIAEQVMRIEDPDKASEYPQFLSAPFSTEHYSKPLQQCIHLDTEAPPSRDAMQHTEGAIKAIQGEGRPLSVEEKSFFEPRFRRDFSKVRIHNDSHADAAAKALGALAYTHGTNIVFRYGAYNTSTEGRRLLAHELCHVIQQQSLHSRNLFQLTRDPDLVHNGHYTFYLRTGASARELAVQLYYPGEGRNVTVKIAHLQSTPNMSQGTFQLPDGVTFSPTILTEGRGVTTLDFDGDGNEDMQILSSVESYSMRLPTTSSTPTSASIRSFHVTDVYIFAQFGNSHLVIEAPGQGLPERAIWSPRWKYYSHPHPNIGIIWRDTLTNRYHIPPMGTSLPSLHSPPPFIQSRLPIASRYSWNARPPITNEPNRSYETYSRPLTEVYDSIVVHHAGNAGYRTMSEVQNLHIDEKERADIGYHFGIDLSGRVYTGRPLQVKGAHVAGANTGKIGIVLLADLDTNDEGVIVDFSDDTFTDRMQASLIRLIEQLHTRFPGIRYLGGHKEFDQSRHCPGNLTMARMNTLRSVTNLQPPP